MVVREDREEFASVCEGLWIILTIHDADTESYLDGVENDFSECGEE